MFSPRECLLGLQSAVTRCRRVRPYINTTKRILFQPCLGGTRREFLGNLCTAILMREQSHKGSGPQKENPTVGISAPSRLPLHAHWSRLPSLGPSPLPSNALSQSKSPESRHFHPSLARLLPQFSKPTVSRFSFRIYKRWHK